MSNTATTLGINAVNKSRQSNVEAQAVTLINAILANQKAIKSNDGLIAEEQKKLAAIALDVADQKTVIGAEWGPTLNVNQATILNALKKLNDSRQESVSIASQGIINRIESYRATTKGLNDQIEKFRKELSELAVDVVTVDSVVGQ